MRSKISIINWKWECRGGWWWWRQTKAKRKGEERETKDQRIVGEKTNRFFWERIILIPPVSFHLKWLFHKVLSRQPNIVRSTYSHKNTGREMMLWICTRQWKLIK